jgi:nicotinate-nucleotide adenylyltransferase
MKFGLFGGSFDPVHLGHLLVAQAAMEELQLDELFFIPAAQSPFKPENSHAPGKVRAQLLRLALAGKTKCHVDDQEIQRGGVSYTIDSLRHYSTQFPQAQLFYLVGADNVGNLPKWKESSSVAKMAEFIAISRPGQADVSFPSPFRGRMLMGFPCGISSSQIRERVKRGLTIDHLVSPPVAEAIHNNRLYL